MVEAKRRLAEAWNKVLRARATVLLLEQACLDKQQLAKRGETTSRGRGGGGGGGLELIPE